MLRKSIWTISTLVISAFVLAACGPIDVIPDTGPEATPQETPTQVVVDTPEETPDISPTPEVVETPAVTPTVEAVETPDVTPTPADMETPEATPAPDELTDEELIAMGEEVFQRACAACHQEDGQGIQGVYPNLNQNPFVTFEDPTPVIQVVLTGRAGMPSFDGPLDDEEIASVVSYIRNAWANDASVVQVDQVDEVRQRVAAPEAEPQEEGPDEEGEGQDQGGGY